MTATATRHIYLDDRGVAWVDQTNTKVIEIVLDQQAHGSTVAEMHLQHPHLSMAQIHAALGYYHDHQAELDEQIRRDREEVVALRAQAPVTPGRQKLRRAGLRP
jgi:uncharacterized protein (DUF433 family)